MIWGEYKVDGENLERGGGELGGCFLLRFGIIYIVFF